MLRVIVHEARQRLSEKLNALQFPKLTQSWDTFKFIQGRKSLWNTRAFNRNLKRVKSLRSIAKIVLDLKLLEISPDKTGKYQVICK